MEQESTPASQFIQAPKLPSGTGETKTYHTRFPGSTFIARDGKVHSFTGADLSTEDLGLQYELDQLADKSGSPIFTKKPVISYEDKAPVNDIQARAATVIEGLRAAEKSQQS